MKVMFPFVLAAALMLAGCSSTPTRIDHGPIQGRTFNFFDTGAKAIPSYAEKETLVHAKIQETITRNLAAKGLAKVATGGDITVCYLVIMSNGVSTSAIDAYFGDGVAGADLQDKAHDAFAVHHKQETPYPVGTLVIDLVDSKTCKILNRNFVYRPILGRLPIQERVSRLQEAVDEALKEVRLVQ